MKSLSGVESYHYLSVEAWWPGGTAEEWHTAGRPKMAGMESRVTP